jgi:hypothetical protein
MEHEEVARLPGFDLDLDRVPGTERAVVADPDLDGRSLGKARVHRGTEQRD